MSDTALAMPHAAPAFAYCGGFGDVVRYNGGRAEYVECPKCGGSGAACQPDAHLGPLCDTERFEAAGPVWRGTGRCGACGSHVHRSQLRRPA